MNNNRKMRKTLLAVIPIESPLFEFHPVSRLVLFIITGIIPLFINQPEVNLSIVALVLVLFVYSKVSLKSLKVYMPVIIGAGIFTFLTFILFPGETENYTKIGSLIQLEIYYEPIMKACIAYSKILALLLSSIFYFSTNRERDILASLRAIKVPFVISYVLGLSLRSAGMFLDDLKTVREAEQARGLDYSTMKFVEKVKLYSMYIIPLLTLAFRRSDEISNALYVKGYSLRGGGKRPDYILTKYKFALKDTVACGTLVLLLIIIILLKYKFNLFSEELSIIRYIL